MKRREFLVGSAGVLGASIPWVAGAQSKPCPPPSTQVAGGSSATTTCGTVSGTLPQACAALSAGQSADFPAGAQTAFIQDDLEWQSVFHHDDTHGLIHLMGKPANTDNAWKHQYYTIATNAWTVVSNGMWNNSGHIYGDFAMDFTSGDLYQIRATNITGSGTVDQPGRAGWWRYATKTWGYAPVNQDIFSPISGMDQKANGCAYHPNLFGPGDGGMIWNEQISIHFWRKSTDAVSTKTLTYGAYGELYGMGVYWPAKDFVLIGGAWESTGNVRGHLLKVSANPTAGGAPVITDWGLPPINTEGGSRAYVPPGGMGTLHVHPLDPNRLVILDSIGQSCYTSTDGQNWTQVADHPFTRLPRVVCSLRGGLGCFWAVGVDNTNGSSISTLWKPGF